MVDWKDSLNPEIKEILKEVLERSSYHRYAYTQADDVRIAQLWVAIAELARDIKEVKEMLGKVEQPFKAIIEVGEAEKKKAIERIVEEILRPTDEATKEAAKKLVDTLMQF